MYYKHHTKAIVLNTNLEGDSSKFLRIFTEDLGLVFAKVQGARNIHSKLRSGVQDFSFGEFSLVSGKLGWKVVSVRPEKNYFEILKNEKQKVKVVGNVFNLIKRLVETDSIQKELFKVVLNFLDFIVLAKDDEVSLIECLTLMRILHILGFMRHDPDFVFLTSSSNIDISHLKQIAPKRSKLIELINESLKVV